MKRSHCLSLVWLTAVAACGDGLPAEGFWLVQLDAQRVAAGSDGHVLVAGDGCEVHKLHRDTGVPLWSQTAGCEADVAVGQGDEAYVLGAASAVGVNGWSLTRLAEATGEPVWQRTLGSGPAHRHDIAASGAGRIATLRCGILTGSITRVCTVAVHVAADGAPIWSTLPVEGIITDVAFTSDGDVLLAYGGTSVEFDASDHLLLLDGGNGSTLWDTALVGGSDASLGGGVVTGDTDGGGFVGGSWAGQSDVPPVLHYVAADGTPTWSLPIEFMRDTISAAVALPELDAVCIGGVATESVLPDAGGVVALLDAADGAVLRQVELGRPVLSAAAEPGNRVYIALDDQVMAMQW